MSNEIIQLTSPIVLNGVTTDKITMREPAVGDQLSARKLSKTDDEQFELVMLANLIGCSPSDLHQMTLRDYASIQKAYLRLSTG